MPNYTVRMDTGDGPDDGEPMEFNDPETACLDAQVAMAEVAREKIPGQSKAHLKVEIDDEAGEAVYRAEMDFKGRAGAAQETSSDTADELAAGPRD